MEKRSVLEGLTDCYLKCLRIGSEGYVIGFYNELNEPVKKVYLFPKGIYKLIHSEKDFLLFKYETLKNEKRN